MSHTKTVFVDTRAADALPATAPAAPGQVAFLENDTLTASSALTALSGSTANYQILSGNGNSIRFNGADVIKSDRAAYTAGTAQVDFITLATTANNAETMYVKIIDVTDGREKFVIGTFEAPAGSTVAQAEAAIVGAINDSTREEFKNITATADDGTGASSANVEGVIKITAPVDTVLRFACNDASAVNAAGTAVAAAPSVGSPAKVDADLQAGFGFQGVTNQAGPNVVKPVVATAGLTFDRFTVFVKQTHGVREDIHEIIIYTNAANTTADTNLDAWT